MVTSRLVLRLLVLRSSGHQVFSATDQLGPSSFAACGQLGITLGGSQDICEPRRFGLRSEWILGLVSPPCSEIQPYIGHQASLFTSLLLTENKCPRLVTTRRVSLHVVVVVGVAVLVVVEVHFMM